MRVGIIKKKKTAKKIKKTFIFINTFTHHPTEILFRPKVDALSLGVIMYHLSVKQQMPIIHHLKNVLRMP